LPSAPGSTTYNPITVKLWEGFRASIKPHLYSIGRLDRTAGVNLEVGTSFLVGDGILLTNHHVVSELSHGADALQEGQATVTFYQEYQTTDPRENKFPITQVIAIHSTLDLALLQVRLPAPRPALKFDHAAATPATQVATIGYPYKDPRNPLFVDAVFGRIYGVKRAALGEIMDADPQRIFHDCSTLGGNSGSPVLSLATSRVIGVHFTGSFMYRNEAVPAAAVQAFVATST
jgi:S1-C subfamily serine protease